MDAEYEVMDQLNLRERQSPFRPPMARRVSFRTDQRPEKSRQEPPNYWAPSNWAV
jgi:hypothetical protein